MISRWSTSTIATYSRVGRAIVSALLLATHLVPACMGTYSECGQETLQCFEAAAGFGGIAGSGSVGGPLASGGTAPQGDSQGGEGGSAGGDGSSGGRGPLARLGEACSKDGLRACAGTASRFPLVCEQGVWMSAGQCSWEERCATAGSEVGVCQLVLEECLDHEPGAWVCAGETTRFRCGADLLDRRDLETCDTKCEDGACWECLPEDAGPPECVHNGVETCSTNGKWTLTPCPSDAPYCADGACALPPSCRNGPQCGPAGKSTSCCTSPVVVGGTFVREQRTSRPATVSSFRLDRFEVPNTRFDGFINAWNAGWRPAHGSGRHVHLANGAGLSTAEDVFETGWDADWGTAVDFSMATRTGDSDPFATTRPLGGPVPLSPVNFVNFYEAFAFCIWDGGFLPSAAEWAYAASGGDDQLTFPWGDDLPGANAMLAAHDCWFGTTDGVCVDRSNIANVGSTAGVGLFGQLDLAGNVAERVQGGLTVSGTCSDCLELTTATPVTDQVRGGAFDSDAAALRNDATPPSVSRTTRSAQIGFRCARPP